MSEAVEAELVHVPKSETGGNQVIRAADFAPIFTIEERLKLKDQMNQFINKIMLEGTDYGPLPGGNQDKKVLMKAGAEKLCSIFGLTPRFAEDKIIEDWNGADHRGEPLFYYSYRCQLYRGDRFMGEAIGSCNSWEAKYRWRWMIEDEVPAQYDLNDLARKESHLREPVFAVTRADTTGRYGKPPAYWAMWKEAIQSGKAVRGVTEKRNGDPMDVWEIETTMFRVPNPDIADCINTCQKMAQKRALVASVLVVTNCSDAFTQDLEEQYGQEEETNGKTQASEGVQQGTSAGAPRAAAEPPSAPRGSSKKKPQPAQQQALEDPRVEGFYKRVEANPAELVDVLGEICDTLRGYYGEGMAADALVNKAYDSVFKLFGDPFQKHNAAIVRPFLNQMLSYVVAEENKKEKK